METSKKKPFYRIAAVAALACLLTGCGSSTQRETADLTKVTYQLDRRSGECFAVVGYTTGNLIERLLGFSNGFTITWVPCTPKVLGLIDSGG